MYIFIVSRLLLRKMQKGIIRSSDRGGFQGLCCLHFCRIFVHKVVKYFIFVHKLMRYLSQKVFYSVHVANAPTSLSRIHDETSFIKTFTITASNVNLSGVFSLENVSSTTRYHYHAMTPNHNASF